MKKKLHIVFVAMASALMALSCVKSVDYYYLDVKAEDSSKGDVTGSGSYAKGSQVTISATANNGYGFTRWSDGSHENPHNVTVNRNMEYIAYFGTAVVQFGDRTWLPKRVNLHYNGNISGTIISDNFFPETEFVFKAQTLGVISDIYYLDYYDDEYYGGELDYGMWKMESATVTLTKLDLNSFETSFEINATMVGVSAYGHYGEHQNLIIRLTDMFFNDNR